MNSNFNVQQRQDCGKYYFSTIMALLIWSTSFIGTKITYSTFPPITLAALRFIIASIILGITIILKKEFVRPSRKDMGIMSLSGILGITLYFTMENTGVNLTTASNAALIVASYPAITSLLELIIYKIKPSVFKVLGIIFAMIGIYILTFAEDASRDRGQYIGNLILVATGIVWAFYNFTTRKIVNKYPAVTVSFYQTVSGTICFIPLAFFEKTKWLVPTVMSLSVLFYLGVFCSVAAFLLYNYGLRKLSSGTAVSLMNLVPVFGVIFSILILHETVAGKQIVGGLIVIFGVLLSIKKSFKTCRYIRRNFMLQPSKTQIQNSFQTVLPETPNRCVIIMDKNMQGGLLANAIAVIALTVGQRHPVLVGDKLVDASNVAHPGLIPTGIPMLCASQAELIEIRKKALDNGCDVVDFPVEGQQTKNYSEFIEMTAKITTENMKYTGIALIGQKKPISKIVNGLDLIE